MNVGVDLRQSFGPSRDQGPRPTCLVFATSAAHEAGRGDARYLSVEYLYFMGAKRSHGDPKLGLSPRAIWDALQKDGQPHETGWPYKPKAPAVSKWKAPSVAPVYKASLAFASRTVAEVVALLQNGKPVILGLALTKRFYIPDGEARVLPDPGAVETAKHAVLAVGTGTDPNGQYLLIRNSWGETWGDAGHAWLHEEYVRERVLTTGVIQ